jgi:SAM-dependent methyltransferase
MSDILVKLIGWKATVLHGDPTTYDRWKWLRRHLSPGPLRTLEAGCGSGAFTMYAAEIGNHAIGISFNERNMQVAKTRSEILRLHDIQFIVGDLRELDKYSASLGKYDQIICFETIEHILNDRKLVNDLAFLLQPGGKILLTTPYKHYVPLYKDKLSEYEDGGHVRWGYTFEEIRKLFDEAGIDVVTEEYISGFISQKITNLIRKMSMIMPHPIVWGISLPLRILGFLDIPLTNIISYPYLSVGVVGVKR